MKTVGKFLRAQRQKQGKSISQIARKTKIKEKFLQALEEEDYTLLPGLPTSSGFSRSYAQALGLDPDFVAALLRRDFPPATPPPKTSEMALNPASFWTPRTTILTVTLVAAVLLGGYLLRQYLLFAAPPPIKVEHLRKLNGQFELAGKTNPQATVEVNGVQVLVDDAGVFTFAGDLPETNTVEVVATSRTGKQTKLTRQID